MEIKYFGMRENNRYYEFHQGKKSDSKVRGNFTYTWQVHEYDSNERDYVGVGPINLVIKAKNLKEAKIKARKQIRWFQNKGL